MEDKLIEDIKSALGLVGECTDAELMEALVKARNSSHPDSFQDPMIKIKKEEDFKKMNQLYSSFKNYLEKKRAEMFPAKFDAEKPVFDLIQKIDKISSLQDKKRELEQSNQELQHKLTLCEEKQEQINEEKNIQKEEQIALSIKNIYKINKETSITIVSILIILVTQLKTIKSELDGLFGIGNNLIAAALWALFISSLLSVLYKKILKHRINYNMKKIINPKHLYKIRLREKKGYSSDKELFFVESDLYDYVKIEISKFDSIIFTFEREVIYRELINYIILCLNEKQIIKKAIPQKLDIYFELNKASIEFM